MDRSEPTFLFYILIAKNNFTSGRWNGTITGQIAANDCSSITANMKLQVTAGQQSIVPFSIYYGPSDYHILKQYDLKLEKLVNLGQGMYSFVRPLNR